LRQREFSAMAMFAWVSSPENIPWTTLRSDSIPTQANNYSGQNYTGYRSPATNAMLRRRSRGVAKNSLHMKGQAADLRLSSRSVSQVARAATACHAGGVGKYRRSNFTHMDCGVVRSWGG